MVVAGWFCICGASYDFDTSKFFNTSGRPGMQIIWIGSAFALTFIILMLDKDFFETFSYFIYGLICLVLVATIFLAPDIKGSNSWLVLGPFTIQPAEFAKFATALALAKFMSTYNFNLLTFKNFAISCLLFLMPMAFILMQKETGTALVFLAFSLVLYREGMSGFVILSGVCAIIFFVIAMKYGGDMLGITPVGELIVALIILLITMTLVFFLSKDKTVLRIMFYMTLFAAFAGFIISLSTPVNFLWVILAVIVAITFYLVFLAFKNLIWRYLLISTFAVMSIVFMFSIKYVFDDVLEYHQQMRIKVVLGIEDDPSGAGYNVKQSMIAIGSGGFWGKGFLQGTQTKLKYVPEQDTDFIFCTVGEEFGFWGSLFVLGLFAALIIRLIFLAERQTTIFGRVFGYSVASIMFFHLIVNIGMVLGLTPVIGIPLPFFSYGGSSLLGFTLLLIIFLRIDAGQKESL
jgi:rod shape determining protein RodA